MSRNELMNGAIYTPDPPEAEYFKFLTFTKEQFTVTWFYRAFAYSIDVPSDSNFF